MVCGGGGGGGGGTRIYVDVVSARAVPVTTTQYQPDPPGVKVSSTPHLTSPHLTTVNITNISYKTLLLPYWLLGSNTTLVRPGYSRKDERSENMQTNDVKLSDLQ